MSESEGQITPRDRGEEESASAAAEGGGEEMFSLTHQSVGSASLQRRNRAQTSSQSRGSVCYRSPPSDRTGGETERRRKSTPCTSICAFAERKKLRQEAPNSRCCVDPLAGLTGAQKNETKWLSWTLVVHFLLHIFASQRERFSIGRGNRLKTTMTEQLWLNGHSFSLLLCRANAKQHCLRTIFGSLIY